MTVTPDANTAPGDGESTRGADESGGTATVIERPGRERISEPTVAGMPNQTPRHPSLAEASNASRSAPRTSDGSTTVINSPLEALAHAEILRTRNFARICFPVAIAGAVALAFLPGERVATLLMLSAIALACVALIYLIYRTRDPAKFQQDFGIALGWYVPALAVCSAVPYFGPYSPVPVLLVLGIYINAMGQRFGIALSIYSTCAIVQACSGSLAIFGIADPGFVKGEWLDLEIRVICQVLVQIVLLGSFLIARASRRSSLIALAELQRAVRSVAQREALLDEAREELRRALGGGRGRFTEQQIGRYRLGEVIGRGAMGEVYESVDPSGQPVAVKMLGQASLGNPHHVQRFLRELRTATAIDSPNVVRVFEVGEEPLPHLVMERLDGRDLASLLRERRVLSHERVMDLVRQAGAGITAAGVAGIIHRDLKPQNLMLAGSTWKVLDFGVSRLADSGDTLTAGQVIGTPAYMAPEQARGEPVSHRTDLYALAAIAYRALTGQAPHSGGEIADILYRVVHTGPRRPGSVATLPADVDLVLAVGLAKDPADRFGTATEFADALASALTSSLEDSIRARGRKLIARGAWVRDPIAPPAA
jgi:eukaryotic-like serine/threonine-protein kinase